jgi:hypothetical protein
VEWQGESGRLTIKAECEQRNQPFPWGHRHVGPHLFAEWTHRSGTAACLDLDEIYYNFREP